MDNTLIKEPDLFFGNNGNTIDPKIGLINFGPFGRFSSGEDSALTIRAGIIATKKTRQLFESWLEKLKHRITGKLDESSNTREVDFPGISLESPLRFKIQIDDSCCETINESEINKLEALQRKDRIVKALEIYDQKFSDLASSSDPSPDIVFLPLSEKLMKLCKDSKYATEKIVYEYRTFKKSKSYDDVPLFDFHHALKVVSYKHGKLVSQMIRPSTLNFNALVQDPAKIGWNFAVATYYKATGIPWKLSDIDKETCYVGLSFYQEIGKGKKNMRASMAHVYLRTGESQVIRGKPFKWEEEGKRPSLSSGLAYNIIEDVIELYKRQRNGVLPKRVVVHKTSPFTPEEVEGFDKAVKGIEMADYIHINENNGILLFPQKAQYPPIRGTFIYGNKKFLLYTTGYVPCLDTYMGSSVPSPLFMEAYRLDSSPEQVGKDIMALTKLDWNNADFNRRLPVTISVSRKVGSILSESSAQEITMPSNYRHYM